GAPGAAVLSRRVSWLYVPRAIRAAVWSGVQARAVHRSGVPRVPQSQVVHDGPNDHRQRSVFIRSKRNSRTRGVRGHPGTEFQTARGGPWLRQQPRRAHVADADLAHALPLAGLALAGAQLTTPASTWYTLPVT